MVRQLMAFGGAAVKVGTNVILGVRLLWYVSFLLFVAVLVYDLFRIPALHAIVDSRHISRHV